MTSDTAQDSAPERPAPEDAGAGAAAAPATPPTPEERIAALEAEVATLRDKWLRAEAEVQNLRNRALREVQEARAYAVQRFAAEVVEVAENLRRGLAALPPPAEDEPPLLAKLRGGFEGLEKSFWAALERCGVTRHDAQGQPFDPALHQAMQEQPAPEGVAPGTVLQAWSAAWMLNGRLLKPAMVVVATGEGDTARTDAA